MRARLELYRSWAKDLADNAAAARNRLTMPVLALGGELFWAGVILESMRELASNVRGAVIPGARHWLPKEHPDQVLSHLLPFLGASEPERSASPATQPS